MINLISLKTENNINIVYKINNYNNPEKVYIPISNLENNIKINDYVYKNSFFKNYISSISGKISDVEKLNYDNKNIDSIVIENDYKENVNEKAKKCKVDNKEDLNNLLISYKYDKLLNQINEIKNIDNLIISSIDKEEYSKKEFIRLSNNTKEILETLDKIANILNVKRSLIVAKNTNFKSVKNVKSILGTYPNIKINLVPDKYLIDNKEFLCEYLNLTTKNSLVLTTNELYNIYLLLKGKHIIENLITISGNAIEKGMIINTRLGVSLKELIKEYINITYEDYDIYINGNMFGYKVKNSDVIISNDVEYIVINKKENNKDLECINCGACNKICPFNINVKACYEKKLKHKKCIGCGLCNYICPANINLKEIVKSGNVEKKYK